MKKILAALLLAALVLTLCACGLIAQPEYTPIPSPTPAPADVDLFRVDMGESEAEPAEEAVRAAVKDYYDRKGIAYNPEDFKETDDEELHKLGEE